MPSITDVFTGDIRSPLKGQVIYRDDNLKGFGLRITPKSRSFIAECKVNGITRRVTLGRPGSITSDEARLQAENVIKQMSAARQPPKRSTQAPTLSELLAIYLARKTLRPATVLTYSRVIDGCLSDWLDKPITMITEEMVQTRHRELSKPNHMGTLGHDQANSAMHVLSRLLNYAAANLESADGQPILTSNPVRKLNQNKLWYKTNRRELVVPDHKLAEWYQAIMSLESTMIRDYLLLLILTGLRRTEAISLKWSDINFDDQTLTIPAEISKNHREHKLPLSDFILALLAQRKDQAGHSQWVFPRSDADQYMAYPYDAIQVVAKLAGCPFTPHALRRTFCSVAARSGVGHHLIRKLVNHTQVLDVAHKYILNGVEGLREPMQEITDRFLGFWAARWQNGPLIVSAQKLPAVVQRYQHWLRFWTNISRLRRCVPGPLPFYEKAIWTGLKDWAHLPVTEITPKMVLAKHRELSQSRKPSYANLPFQVLRLLLYFAAQEYQTPTGRPLIEVNPIRQLFRNHAPKKLPTKQTVIPDEKLADWYKAVLTETSPAIRDSLLFFSFTGTTRAQGLKLRWDDLDFESKTIRIRPEVCQNHRGFALPMTEFSKRLLCVATFWLLSFSQASSTNNKEPKKVIIYARLNISKGMMIGDAEIQEKVIFARKTPPNTVACRKDAIGHYATCAIKTGQVILTSYLKSDRPGYKQTRPTHGNCTKLTFVRAKVAIPAGSVIRRGDLETFTVGVDAAEPGWLSEAEVIVGRRAKVSIIAGRILTYDLIDTNKQFAGSREKAR